MPSEHLRSAAVVGMHPVSSPPKQAPEFVPWHVPPPQTSLIVQTSLSSQGAVLSGWLHEPAPSQ